MRLQSPAPGFFLAVPFADLFELQYKLLKGGHMGDYIGEYYRGYEEGYKEFRLCLICSIQLCLQPSCSQGAKKPSEVQVKSLTALGPLSGLLLRLLNQVTIMGIYNK